MNHPLATIALISVGVGIGFAILLLILVQLKRRDQQVNSLVDPNDLIGLTGIVQIPFDKSSKGKIRVNIQGNLLDLTAITESEDDFKVGNKVLILQFKENRVIVISEKYLRSGYENI
jgi:membrane protein implicated in regulation of membrane protease activity